MGFKTLTRMNSHPPLLCTHSQWRNITSMGDKVMAYTSQPAPSSSLHTPINKQGRRYRWYRPVVGVEGRRRTIRIRMFWFAIHHQTSCASTAAPTNTADAGTCFAIGPSADIIVVFFGTLAVLCVRRRMASDARRSYR